VGYDAKSEIPLILSMRVLSNLIPLRSIYFHSSVGIEIGYGLDDRRVGVRALVGSRIFCMSSRPALGFTKPSIKWVPGILSLAVKWPGHEADHSSPATAEVKKMWIYTSTPPYVFMV
jgi:hypothetical protein